MTHTQPACSPMHAAMLPVAERTAASSTPTANRHRKASAMRERILERSRACRPPGRCRSTHSPDPPAPDSCARKCVAEYRSEVSTMARRVPDSRVMAVNMAPRMNVSSMSATTMPVSESLQRELREHRGIRRDAAFPHAKAHRGHDADDGQHGGDAETQRLQQLAEEILRAEGRSPSSAGPPRASRRATQEQGDEQHELSDAPAYAMERAVREVGMQQQPRRIRHERDHGEAQHEHPEEPGECAHRLETNRCSRGAYSKRRRSLRCAADKCACDVFLYERNRHASAACAAPLSESRARQCAVTEGSDLMQEHRARQILQSLVQGVDPFDGEELPAGTVLQQADVLRALLAGVAALEQGVARASRRAQLPKNIGRSWSAEEQSALIDAFQAGEALSEIAARHGRTLRAIEARLEKLGLIATEERTTPDRFGPRESPPA